MNYAIFAFKCSNPLGGMNDLYDTSDTLEGAINLAKELLTNVEKQIDLNYIPEIAQIMCLKTCKIVKKIKLSDLLCMTRSEFEEYDNDIDGYIDISSKKEKEIQYVVPIRVRYVLYKGQNYLQYLHDEFTFYNVDDVEQVEHFLCNNCKNIKIYSMFKIINNAYICNNCSTL
jgi:hypothetical protein